MDINSKVRASESKYVDWLNVARTPALLEESGKSPMEVWNLAGYYEGMMAAYIDCYNEVKNTAKLKEANERLKSTILYLSGISLLLLTLACAAVLWRDADNANGCFAQYNVVEWQEINDDVYCKTNINPTSWRKLK